MKKKVLALVLCIALVAALTIGLVACNNDKMVTEKVPDGVTIENEVNVAPTFDMGDLSGKSLKVGIILIGDSTEGYTEAHISGLEAAKNLVTNAGGTVTFDYHYNIPDEQPDQCDTAITECIASGCQLIISNSFGFQMPMYAKAQANPNIKFISMTNDMSLDIQTSEDTNETTITRKLNNFSSAFTNVYESRYMSGVVAGMKLKQLVDDNLVAAKNKDANGNIKLGYVGAHPFAEVKSGFTAFFLGVQSIVPNVVMQVKYTNSWSDFNAEMETAKSLIADGCIIIGQHADTQGAPTACENAYKNGTRVYSVGYNVSMLNAAPHAALVSATNNWKVYYAYALKAALNNETIDASWAKGYSDGAVALTNINGKVFSTDPSSYVMAVVEQLKNGTLKVFDCSKFTVNGQHLKSYKGAYGLNGAEAIKQFGTDGYYFAESVLRCAPYFDIVIDGITSVEE